MVEQKTSDKNPNIIEMAKKKRHIYLLEKIQKEKTLTSKELRELAEFESSPKPPGLVSTQEEVAQAFKVSVRTVQYWIRDGMPVAGDGQYDLTEIQAWRLMLQGRGGKRKGESDATDKDWETEYRKFKALLAELDYEKALGEVISKDEVERSRVARVLAVKRALLALPRTLAPQIKGLEPREIEVIIMDRIREIISLFAGENLPKEKMKKKAKRRRKRK